MASLYDLTNEYKNIYAQMDDPEVDEESFIGMLGLINEDIHEKAENYAKVIKNVEGDVEAYKKEIDRLTEKKRCAENNIKRMKESLQYAMEVTGEKKFSTALFSFNIQKNPATCEFDVGDEDIPAEYHVKQPDKIDKKAVIAALKDETKAKGLEGIARLVQTESLRIR